MTENSIFYTFDVGKYRKILYSLIIIVLLSLGKSLASYIFPVSYSNTGGLLALLDDMSANRSPIYDITIKILNILTVVIFILIVASIVKLSLFDGQTGLMLLQIGITFFMYGMLLFFRTGIWIVFGVMTLFTVILCVFKHEYTMTYAVSYVTQLLFMRILHIALFG